MRLSPALARGREALTRWRDELAFCAAFGASRQDALGLAWATAGFHLANHVPWVGSDTSPEGARAHRVRMAGVERELWLRPRTGDVFVLHEIFRLEAYRLPTGWLEGVRTVVDLGANIGLVSLYWASLLPQARFACVEPSRENLELLRRNLAGLGGRATIIAGAAAPEPGRIRFLEGPTWGGRTEVGSSAPGYEVEALDPPTLMALAGFDRIDLLKVDIEGAERELFGSGDRSWLERVDRIVIELHDGYDAARLSADLAPWGLSVRPPSPTAGHEMVVALREGRAG